MRVESDGLELELTMPSVDGRRVRWLAQFDRIYMTRLREACPDFAMAWDVLFEEMLEAAYSGAGGPAGVSVRAIENP